VKLIELFCAPDRAVVRGPEGGFANEVVLTFVRPHPPTPAPPPAPTPKTTRAFAPGSSWLYAKLYCGASTGDRVLKEAIAPVVRAALADGDATHWFFIRYADPDEHVRVRIAGDPARLAARILPALHDATAPLMQDGAVRKLVLDTYVRELERYGGDAGIEPCERIFWRDSEAVLGIVELLDGDAGADARWRLTLRGIDQLLSALGLDPDTHGKIVQRGRDMLGAEHNADADFWTRLGERFNKDKADLTAIFARDPAIDAAHDLEPGFTLLAERDRLVAPIADELRAAGVDVAELAWSLCHMHANRLLHASQRTQELVLYEFLRRLHATRKARAGAK
jgi:thiopeptide-type bacteriocin biosynthesis protein